MSSPADKYFRDIRPRLSAGECIEAYNVRFTNYERAVAERVFNPATPQCELESIMNEYANTQAQIAEWVLEEFNNWQPQEAPH